MNPNMNLNNLNNLNNLSNLNTYLQNNSLTGNLQNLNANTLNQQFSHMNNQGKFF